MSKETTFHEISKKFLVSSNPETCFKAEVISVLRAISESPKDIYKEVLEEDEGLTLPESKVDWIGIFEDYIKNTFAQSGLGIFTNEQRTWALEVLSKEFLVKQRSRKDGNFEKCLQIIKEFAFTTVSEEDEVTYELTGEGSESYEGVY